jgi:hypothetical protein
MPHAKPQRAQSKAENMVGMNNIYGMEAPSTYAVLSPFAPLRETSVGDSIARQVAID